MLFILLEILYIRVVLNAHSSKFVFFFFIIINLYVTYRVSVVGDRLLLLLLYIFFFREQQNKIETTNYYE